MAFKRHTIGIKRGNSLHHPLQYILRVTQQYQLIITLPDSNICPTFSTTNFFERLPKLSCAKLTLSHCLAAVAYMLSCPSFPAVPSHGQKVNAPQSYVFSSGGMRLCMLNIESLVCVGDAKRKSQASWATNVNVYDQVWMQRSLSPVSRNSGLLIAASWQRQTGYVGSAAPTERMRVAQCVPRKWLKWKHNQGLLGRRSGGMGPVWIGLRIRD